MIRSESFNLLALLSHFVAVCLHKIIISKLNAPALLCFLQTFICCHNFRIYCPLDFLL